MDTMKPPEIPLYGRVLIAFVVSVLVIFSALGNSLVLCVLNRRRTPSRITQCCTKQISPSPSSALSSPGGRTMTKRSVTYTFLVNLSISDLLHILICAPFTLISDFLLIYWPFGETFCRLVNYLQGVVVFLCAFTHVIISIDRLTAIRCPIWRRRKLSVRNARMILGFIWLCAMIIPIPSLIVCRIVVDEDGLSHCQELWPEGNNIQANQSNISYSRNDQHFPSHMSTLHQGDYQRSALDTNPVSLELIYNCLVMLLQYMLPLSVIIVTYSAIVYQVWVTTAPGEGNIQRDKKIRASKKKLIKMVIIVASLYAISQLPRHLIYIITVNKPDAFQRDTIIYTWLLCQLSAWSATCYNPIVYIWMSNTFRRGLFDLFKNLCPWIIRCKHHVHHKSKQCAAYHRNSHHHHHHHPHRHHCHHNHHHGSDCSQCYNNHPCPKHQQYFHSLQKTITHPYSSSSSNSKMKKFNQTQNDDSDEYSFNQTENIKMNITENTTIITAVNNTTIHTSYDEDDDDDDDEEEEEEEEQEVYQDGHVKQTRSLHDYDTDLTESDK